MYSRQNSDGRFSRGLRIPGNYSGNAFRTEVEEDPRNDNTGSTDTESVITESGIADALPPKKDSDTAVSDTAVPTGFSRVWGRSGGGIGLEELLILGLALIVSQNDSKDDLAFLLLILLFIQ